MSTLLQFDYWLFFLINSEWSNPLFDQIMPFIRNKYFWLPIYVFTIAWIIAKYNSRVRWYLLLNICTCIVLTDMLCSQLLKPFISRVRPCNETVFWGDVVERVTCGYGLSFPSIHAANHFALSILLIILINPSKSIKGLLLLWAMLISFAQIYVGVHYPLDVVGGALIGVIMARLFGDWAKKYQ